MKSGGAPRWTLLLVLFPWGCEDTVHFSEATSLSPYPASSVFSGVTFRSGTHRREAPGADNWPITWASDGNQYAHWGDGNGWDGRDASQSGNGVNRISGEKGNYTGTDRYASGRTGCGDLCGKSYGILALGSTLYMWLSPNSNTNNWNRATLYKSLDWGASWRSTAVEFTQSDGLGVPFFLQAGQDYRAAEDGYLYIYFTEIQDGLWEVQKPGQHALARVRPADVENEAAYEFWTGQRGGGGTPAWGSLSARTPVFEDPNGVMRSSIIYLPQLHRYVLITNHTARNQGNIAMFDAPHPWGPWSTFLYESGWPQGGEVPVNTFYWNISPKWLSNGDRDFVLVFTGKEANDAWNSVEGSFSLH